MKKFIVFLLVFSSLILVQVPDTQAGRSQRLRHHPSSSSQIVVITSTPGHPVHLDDFTHRVFIVPSHHFVFSRVLISDPFFCFDHRVGFINEAGFFDHLHRHHGIAFEAIPSVIVHSGSQVFFFRW